MAQLSRRIAKGLVGSIALSVTFGAVASGRDLGHQAPSSAVDVADASAGAINRAAKSDRAVMPQSAATKTLTFSMRLNDLSNTSVLIRMPVSRDIGNAAPASLVTRSGNPHAIIACEPSVSVLTEVAKLLPPGRCVT